MSILDDDDDELLEEFFDGAHVAPILGTEEDPYNSKVFFGFSNSPLLHSSRSFYSHWLVESNKRETLKDLGLRPIDYIRKFAVWENTYGQLEWDWQIRNHEDFLSPMQWQKIVNLTTESILYPFVKALAFPGKIVISTQKPEKLQEIKNGYVCLLGLFEEGPKDTSRIVLFVEDIKKEANNKDIPFEVLCAKVLLHELAHFVMYIDDEKQPKRDRYKEESNAEAIALMCLCTSQHFMSNETPRTRVQWQKDEEIEGHPNKDGYETKLREAVKTMPPEYRDAEALYKKFSDYNAKFKFEISEDGKFTSLGVGMEWLVWVNEKYGLGII